jgi:phosphatidylethanolamine-binding protein (PEBP) family uncharacterized protein
VLSSVTAFEVAVEATVWALVVEDEDGFQRQRYFCCVVANVQGFKIHKSF